MRKLLIVLVAAASAAHAQSVRRDIAYGPAPQQVLDLYTPARTPAPLVVFVHGGGWFRGDKAGSAHLASVLRGEGYAVADVDYRLLGPGVTIQAQAADVMAASAALLRDAGRYGIDPGHFALIGHSAGGQLVALDGADPAYARQAGLDPSKLALVITLDGVFNLHLPQEVRALRRWVSTDPANLRAISPIDQLDTPGPRPAFCLIHEDEQPRFILQADQFAAALHAHGIPEEEAVAPGLRHIDLVVRFDDPGTATSRLVAGCLNRYFKTP